MSALVEAPAIAPGEGSNSTGEGAGAVVVDPLEVVDAEDLAPELDPLTGVPKTLKAYLVHQDPDITVVPHFASEAECLHLLELCEPHWIPSVVGTGVYKTNDESKDLQNKASSNRTSYSCMLRSAHTPQVERLEHRLAHLAGLDVDYLERLNMVRYHPGQFFNRHHDGRFRPKTVFLYLNDLEEDSVGGETFFSEIGLKIKPRRGCAVIWSNILGPGVEDPRTYHCGLPPTSGVKYGVNCFFNDKPLKQWEDDGSDEGETETGPARTARSWTTVDGEELLAKAEPLSPGKLRSFAVCQAPRVCVLPKFLSPEEAAMLAAFASPPDLRAASPSSPSTEHLAAIEARMAAVAGLPLVQMETLKVSRCEPGMTPDGKALAKSAYAERFGHRVLCIFLNDVADGGEIRFPRLGFQVAAREGCAVLWHTADAQGAFDARGAHQGRAPRAGLRLVATGVFRGAPVRT